MSQVQVGAGLFYLDLFRLDLDFLNFYLQSRQWRGGSRLSLRGLQNLDRSAWKVGRASVFSSENSSSRANSICLRVSSDFFPAIINLQQIYHMKSVSVKSSQPSSLKAALSASAVGQRQHLKALVLNRFITDYSRGNTRNLQIIQTIVHDFFVNQKISEDSLRKLKQKVIQACVNNKPSRSVSIQQPQSMPSQAQHAPPLVSTSQGVQLPPLIQNKPDQNKDRAVVSRGGRSVSSSSSATSSVTSNYSKMMPGNKSIYVAQGDGDNEWATLVKFDTQLFKKQKQLEKLRDIQMRKRLKEDLDRQIQDKLRRKQMENSNEAEYQLAQEKMRQQYDQREVQKQQEMESKLRFEKKLRDKQVREQRKRKKKEDLLNADIERRVVEQVQKQLSLQKEQLERKKQNQKERFKEMLTINEETLRRNKQDQTKERQEEVRLQNQYNRLLKEEEDKRERQKRQREERTKHLMGTYADNVMKDQHNQIAREDEKMLKYMNELNHREKTLEEQKRLKANQDKQEMRRVLAKQLQQKNQKLRMEQLADQEQAHVWKEDLSSHIHHQKQKQNYLKDVYNRHQEVLMNQISQKRDKGKFSKMNTLELLYNKALMKEAAQGSGVKKQVVGNVHRD